MQYEQIIIADSTRKRSQLCTIPDIETHESQYELSIVYGGVESPDEKYIVRDGIRKNETQFITSDEYLAFQYALQRAEQLQCTESYMLRELAEIQSPIDGNHIIGTLTNKSRSEYITEFTTMCEKVAGTKYDPDKKIALFLQQGKARDTPETKSFIRDINEYIPLEHHNEDGRVRNCYETAYEVVDHLQTENAFEAVVYCEGVATPKYGGVPVLHAWVEINGAVIEPTWNWTGTIPPESAIYYGDSFPWNQVVKQMSANNTYTSIVSSQSANRTP